MNYAAQAACDEFHIERRKMNGARRRVAMKNV